MGLDLRVIAEERVEEIPDAMERAGFSVAVEQRTVDTSPERCKELGIQPPGEPVVFTLIRCARGKEQITLSVIRDDEQFAGFRVYIPNLSSWWPPRKRKRRQLQADVTAVLEDCGAYLPLPGGSHDSKAEKQ